MRRNKTFGDLKISEIGNMHTYCAYTNVWNMFSFNKFHSLLLFTHFNIILNGKCRQHIPIGICSWPNISLFSTSFQIPQHIEAYVPLSDEWSFRNMHHSVINGAMRPWHVTFLRPAIGSLGVRGRAFCLDFASVTDLVLMYKGESFDSWIKVEDYPLGVFPIHLLTGPGRMLCNVDVILLTHIPHIMTFSSISVLGSVSAGETLFRLCYSWHWHVYSSGSVFNLSISESILKIELKVWLN